MILRSVRPTQSILQANRALKPCDYGRAHRTEMVGNRQLNSEVPRIFPWHLGIWLLRSRYRADPEGETVQRWKADGSSEETSKTPTV
jgi:hypothetical protein